MEDRYSPNSSSLQAARVPTIGPQIAGCLIAAYILFQSWLNPDEPPARLATLEGTSPRHGWFYVTDCTIDQSVRIDVSQTTQPSLFSRHHQAITRNHVLFPLRASDESNKSPVKIFYEVEFAQNATGDDESGQLLGGTLRSLTPTEADYLAADHVKFHPNAFVINTQWHAQWYQAAVAAVGGFVLGFFINLGVKKPAA